MIEFKWQKEEADDLVRSCAQDDVWGLIQQYIPKGSTVLESGCGLARYVRFLQDRGWKVVGLEHFTQTVAQVREIWPDLTIVQGDAEHSPFPDNSFDAVLSLGVVEHWEVGPQGPLRDIYRVLRPGGVAIITVPCNNFVRQIKQRIWWYEVTGFPRAVAKYLLRHQPQPLLRLRRKLNYHTYPAYGAFFEYRMTREDFAAELENAGFQIIEQRPTALMDGIYHDLNPFKLVVKFRHWEFFPTRLGRWLNQMLAKKPYGHPHMQAAVVLKPITIPQNT